MKGQPEEDGSEILKLSKFLFEQFVLKLGNGNLGMKRTIWMASRQQQQHGA